MAMLKCQQLSRGIPLSPNRIFCMDETGFCPNLKGKFVMAGTGVKRVNSIVSDSREHMTIVAHASASGQTGNPMFIIPKKVGNFLQNNFIEAKVVTSPTGYINNSLFIHWAEHFV